MKLIMALFVLVAASHKSVADPVPYLETLNMFDEQSMQENQFSSPEEAPQSDDENPESVSALSFDDIKNGKKWNEQSFIAALERLGTLNTPGVKLVKLPKSMIMLMKRMPNHTVIRPSTYVHLPESKAQDDVQCIGVLQDMYTLAHADSRLAYQSQNLKCMGSCTSAKSCVLEQKPVIVYLLDTSHQLVPKKVNVGCTCSCQ